MAIGDSEVGRTAQADPVSQRVQVRRAAMASTIGTTIEWYDFFLYNTAAALVFPHLFFPASSAYAGAMQSFATYAVDNAEGSVRGRQVAIGAGSGVALGALLGALSPFEHWRNVQR